MQRQASRETEGQRAGKQELGCLSSTAGKRKGEKAVHGSSNSKTTDGAMQNMASAVRSVACVCFAFFFLFLLPNI